MKIFTIVLRVITLSLVLLFTVHADILAQVGIGTTTPNARSILDLSATDKGFLPPRLDTTAVTGLGATDAGMLAFNTPDNQLYVWDGATWLAIQSGAAVAQIWDNSGAPDISYTTGNVGIGLSNPTHALQIAGDLRLGMTQPVNDIVNTTVYNTFANAADLFEDMLLTAPATAAMISDSLATVGGLSYFAESLTSGTDSASVWQPSIGTNVGIVLNPRGAAYIAADIPDGTTTGGIARGAYALDLQMARSAADEVASGPYSVIVGGENNSVQSQHAAIVGGINNIATGSRSFVGGGFGNEATGTSSSILGGSNNTITAQNAVIGGGFNNQATVNGAAVFSGSGNESNGLFSFIGGGGSNTSSNDQSVIVGGLGNTVSGRNAFIGAGNGNNSNRESSAIVAGTSNTINTSGTSSFIGAGTSNSIGESGAFIGSGVQNSVTGRNAGILAGRNLTVPSYGETALGYYNTIYTANSTFSRDPGDRLLVVGNGDFTLREDALRLMKSGNMAIGNLNPTARLHVDGDLRLQVGTAVSNIVDSLTLDGFTTADDIADTMLLTGSAIKTLISDSLATTGDNLGNHAITQPFSTTLNFGNVLPIGDDVWLADYNSANGLLLTGQVDPAEAKLRLGDGLDNPTFVGTATALEYFAGGASRFFIQNNSGNFGIGEIAPAAMLDVAGDMRLQVGASVANIVDSLTLDGFTTADDIADTMLLTGSAIKTLISDSLASVGGSVWDDSVFPDISFDTGFVGIGITNPTSMLHVDGDFRLLTGTNVNRILDLTTSDGFTDATSYNDDQLMTAAAINELVSDSLATVGGSLWDDTNTPDIGYASGNVGIGTISPQASLNIVTAGTIAPRSLEITNSYTGATYKYGAIINVDNQGSGNRDGLSVAVSENATDNQDILGIRSQVTNEGTGTKTGYWFRKTGTGTAGTVIGLDIQGADHNIIENPLRVGSTSVPTATLDVAGDLALQTGTNVDNILDQATSSGFADATSYTDNQLMTSRAINQLVSDSLATVGGWALDGNAITNPATEYIGTTTNQRLAFRSNNIEHMALEPNGHLTLSDANSGVIIGSGAAPGNSASNVVIGTDAGSSLTTSSQNVLIGFQTMSSLTNAISNTAVGWRAGRFGTGQQNTLMGFNAGLGLSFGQSNTFIGYQAGTTVGGGSENVALGVNAGPLSSGLARTVAIGSNAKVDQSYSMALGGTGIYALNVGIGTTTPSAVLDVVGDIALQTGTNVDNILDQATSSGFADATSYTDNQLMTALAINRLVSDSLATVGGSLWDDTNSPNIGYAAGNVGVGTNTPANPLAVTGALTDYVATFDNTGGGNAAGIEVTTIGRDRAFRVFRDNGSPFAPMAEIIDRNVGSSQNTLNLVNYGTGNFISFRNTMVGVRSVINNDGNIGIGTTTAPNSLTVNGDMALATGTNVNEITADNATGTYTMTDDNLMTAAAIEDYVANNAGLTHFTESLTTATDSASIWEPSLGTDVGVVIQPKGNGYLAANVPDGTPVGGNARGNNAVDWQMDRANATEVASGNIATIAGGRNNTANGFLATVGGGTDNTATGTYSTIAGGQSNNIGGFALHSSIGGGVANTISGSHSTIGGGNSNTTSAANYATIGGGQSNTASAFYSTVGGGGNNTASGQHATIPGGEELSARSYGEVALGYYNTTYAPNSTSAKDPNDRLLVVGNGVSGTPEDALRLMKSGNMAIGNFDPVTRLDVGGEVKLGNTGLVAATSNAGALRWNAGNVEFSDGTAWNTLGGGSLWTDNSPNISYTTGNVGIGTTTPSNPLQVSANNLGSAVVIDNSSALAGGGLNITSSGTLATLRAARDQASPNTPLARFEENNASSPEAAMRVVHQGTGDMLQFNSNLSTTLSVFDNDGYLGIGTANPATPVALQTGGGQAVGITQGLFGGANTMELTTADATGVQAPRIVIRGGNDDADIEFLRGFAGAEFVNMMIEGPSGNVGIGTTTPNAKLQVNGTFRISLGPSVSDIIPDNNTGTYSMLDTELMTAAAIEDYVANNAGGGSSLWDNTNTPDIGYDAGNVGVGTIAPTGAFEVVSGTTGGTVSQDINTDNGGSAFIVGPTQHAQVFRPNVTGELTEIQFQMEEYNNNNRPFTVSIYQGTDPSSPGTLLGTGSGTLPAFFGPGLISVTFAGINLTAGQDYHWVVNGYTGPNNFGMSQRSGNPYPNGTAWDDDGGWFQWTNEDYEFITFMDPGGPGSPKSALFVEDVTGNVGIGTDSPDAQLSVVGTASKTGGGSWATFSDRRLKKDIKPFVESIATLNKVEPVNYTYNGKGSISDDSTEHVGIIAQKLQAIAPYMVDTAVMKESDGSKSEYLRVNHDAFTFMLINAVKEQQVQIDSLTALVTNLKTADASAGTNAEAMQQMQAQIESLTALVKQLQSTMNYKAQLEQQPTPPGETE